MLVVVRKFAQSPSIFCQLFVRCHFLPQATGHRTQKQVGCSFDTSCLPVTLQCHQTENSFVARYMSPCDTCHKTVSALLLVHIMRFLLHVLSFCCGFRRFILLFLFSRIGVSRCVDALLGRLLTSCRALNYVHALLFLYYLT